MAVFIDQTEARLIRETGGIPAFSGTVESDFESHPRYRGEGSNQARFGRDPYHGSNNEYHENRLEAEIRKRYFHELEKELLPFDEILLFGPGEARKEFHNYLLEQPSFRKKKIHIQASDWLTDNQLLEAAGLFFSMG